MVRGTLKKYNMSLAFTCILGIIYSILMEVIEISSTAIAYPIEVWMNSNEIMVLIYPLVATVPFLWIFYLEKKNGFLKYVYNRVTISKYIFSHYICGILMAFTCMFVISITGAIFGIYIIQPDEFYDRPNFINENLYGALQIYKPLLYAFLLSLWRGFLGMIYYSFGFVVSLYSNNLFLILTIPFVYSILENFVTSLLNLSFFSICTSFDPNIINFNGLNLPPLLALVTGPLVLITISLGIFIYNKYCGEDKDEKYYL